MIPMIPHMPKCSCRQSAATADCHGRDPVFCRISGAVRPNQQMFRFVTELFRGQSRNTGCQEVNWREGRGRACPATPGTFFPAARATLLRHFWTRRSVSSRVNSSCRELVLPNTDPSGETMMRSAFRSLMLRTLVAAAAVLAAGPGISGGAGAAEPRQVPAETPAEIPAVGQPDAEAYAVAIARRLAAPGPLTIYGQVLRNLDTLRQAYARRGFVPGWTPHPETAGPRPAAAVAAMRAAFADSAADGLEPIHYHPAPI